MKKVLPKEITSLIHHITLNEQGWWDKTIQRLIISAFGSNAKKQLSSTELKNFINKNYDSHIDDDKLKRQLEKLCSSQSIIKSSPDVYILSEREIINFNEDISKFEKTEEAVEFEFLEIIQKHCNKNEQKQITWEIFNNKVLVPILYEFGAKTYELITGEGIELKSNYKFKKFLSDFPKDRHVIIQDAIIDFLNPLNPLVRELVLRKLNAYFFLEAIKLSTSAINKINQTSKKQVIFKVFVDTNFLFSFLGLHENPSNEAAKSLLDIITKIKNKVKIHLYIAPITVVETKKVIINEERKLTDVRATQLLSSVAINQISNGFAKKYFEECKKSNQSIKASDYFEPYLDNLITVLRDKGVELYNTNKIEDYSVDQRVIDDILDQQKFEKENFKTRPHLQKSYEILEHDYVLWHFVNDLRPSYVESADGAGAFITTVDFRFINFDRNKRKINKIKIPVCIHPTNLIQILQLWIPRDEEFDIAVLSNLRFPFLFTEFDSETENTTIKIIEQLSRYENIDDLKENTITSILFNKALRQKIQSDESDQNEITLVKDAIIDELKTQNLLLEDKDNQLNLLDVEIKNQEKIVSEITKEKIDTENTNSELVQRLDKLENEKKLESQYFIAKEKWSHDKQFSLYKRWDELPKYKWYMPAFSICLFVVLSIVILLYVYFHDEVYYPILITIFLFLLGTIGLSFFNRDKIGLSFNYNFRTERFRKKKLQEFEKDFDLKSPQPKRNYFTNFNG